MRRSARALVTLAMAAAVALTGCGDGADGSGDAGPEVTPTTGTATPSATATDPAQPTPSATASPSEQPSPGQTPPGQTPSQQPRPVPSTPGAELPARLLGQDWERIPTTRKVVALTFDGGSSADGLDSILDTLDRENVPATFFLTGQFVERFPAAARSIADRGYRIGSHSVSHPYFTQLSDADLRAEIVGAQEAITRVTGADPRPWFRFPYGDRNARTISAVNALGYVPIRWTVDTLGWKGTSGGQSAATVTDRVLAAATNGEIVLMHVGAHPQDRSTLDADALGGIIQQLRARGYEFVTIDAMLD